MKLQVQIWRVTLHPRLRRHLHLSRERLFSAPILLSYTLSFLQCCQMSCMECDDAWHLFQSLPVFRVDESSIPTFVHLQHRPILSVSLYFCVFYLPIVRMYLMSQKWNGRVACNARSGDRTREHATLTFPF